MIGQLLMTFPQKIVSRFFLLETVLKAILPGFFFSATHPRSNGYVKRDLGNWRNNKNSSRNKSGLRKSEYEVRPSNLLLAF